MTRSPGRVTVIVIVTVIVTVIVILIVIVIVLVTVIGDRRLRQVDQVSARGRAREQLLCSLWSWREVTLVTRCGEELEGLRAAQAEADKQLAAARSDAEALRAAATGQQGEAEKQLAAALSEAEQWRRQVKESSSQADAARHAQAEEMRRQLEELRSQAELSRREQAEETSHSI